MRISADYTSPLENTVRKIAFTQLLRTMDKKFSQADEDAKPLLTLGATGVLVKGSAENCLLDPPPAIGRNPRDLDLVILGRPDTFYYKPRRTEFFKFLRQAAQASGFKCEPASANTLSYRDRATELLFDKGKAIADIILTDHWIDEAIAHASTYRLTPREIELLNDARSNHDPIVVQAKIDFAVHTPVQDRPPTKPDGSAYEQGVAISDPCVSLLNKLQAVNYVFRDENTDPSTRYTDMLDIYNIHKRLNEGQGLSEKNRFAIESIIHHGRLYHNRLVRQRLETRVKQGARLNFREAFSLGSVGNDRDTLTLTPPTEASISELHDIYAKSYEANIIAEPVSREKTAEIANLVYRLSADVYKDTARGLVGGYKSGGQAI